MRACERTGSGSFERLDGTATITSVGFSNVSHGQTGRPNAFAVHPLLRPPGALLLRDSSCAPHEGTQAADMLDGHG